MPWSHTGSDPKYHTREHRAQRATYEQLMREQGYLICAQPECVETTRVIQAGERWHVGHDDSGTTYIGPVHAQCNLTDAGKRARARRDHKAWRL